MKIDGLTPQQARVARLVADGLTDKEIAAALHIGRHGVSFHVRRIAARWHLTGNIRVRIASRVQAWSASLDKRKSA